MKEKYFIEYDDISFIEKIIDSNYQHFLAYKSAISCDANPYLTKIIQSNDPKIEDKMKNYCTMLQAISHPTIVPFYSYCLSSQNPMKQNLLILKFAPYSLQKLFDKQKEGQQILWWDLTRKFIVLYGIAISLGFLHSKNIVHQRLTPSNILIDENYEPQITDFQIETLFPINHSKDNLIRNNYFYYIDPTCLNDNPITTAKSDIYALAIIIILVLSGNQYLYENEDDIDSLINEIRNGRLPIIPDTFPDELKQLLRKCLNNDPNLRPSINQFLKQFDSIINLYPEISQNDIFQQYKQKILSSHKKDDVNPEIKQLKLDADDGKPQSMFLYALKLLEGIDIPKNEAEAIKYLKMGRKKNYEPAKIKLDNLNIDNGPTPSTSQENLDSAANYDDVSQGNIHDKKSAKNGRQRRYLADDPSFDKSDFQIDQLLSLITSMVNKESKHIDFHSDEIERQNFIFTEGALKRLRTLYDYIDFGVAVLLEGPTGTSKTLSSEIVCKLLKRELIRFNLSAETKIPDLLGRYIGDEKSWAGISHQDGPFYIAFTEGKVLLLDEINLASPSVLQCIEEALDSKVLNIDIPGKPLQNGEVKMHPDFRLIATQNPNKGSYANKRQELGLKFSSKFQIINFPAFSIDELRLIGRGLAQRFGYQDLDVIDELVQFHKNWSENRLIENDPQCFTVREIAATVKAFSQKEDIYDTIMTIYGARYQTELKNELKKELQKFARLRQTTHTFKMPAFPGCFINESLETAVGSILFSLKNGRNVIITGKQGCGKTQVALWISEYYNNQIQVNFNDQSCFCFCTEDIKVSDLVGRQSPSANSDGEIIQWHDGFLTNSIRKGMCCVLESLDEAPATVTERLNGLLDIKYDNQQKYFDIPENSAESRIPIKDSFRIIATAKIENISQMSPAFLNRFDIIVLENQIADNMNKEQYNSLLITCLNKYCTHTLMQLNTTSSEDQGDSQYLEDSDFEFSGSDSEPDMETIDSEPVQNNPNKEFDHEKIAIQEKNSQEFVQKVTPILFEKIKKEKNIYQISKLCNAVVKLHFSFQNNDAISDNQIVDFAYNILNNSNEIAIPKIIEDELIRQFRKIEHNTDATFFYENSPKLLSFLATLCAYTIIEQHVCITGPTGAGKTSSTRAFAKMRPRKSNFESGFQMHSFHSATKPSHFFGTTTLMDGDIIFNDGTLTKALKHGLVFIADEFNLSTQQVMKSLSLALDPTIGQNVYIPGIGQNITISPEFHFIACQNAIGTLGRNAIPDSIAQRFVYIDYPEQNEADIQNICISILKEIITENCSRVFKQSDETLAKQVASYMIRLNRISKSYLSQWSLRDITKIFRRIYPQNTYKKFRNITPIHHVLFYTMEPIPFNYVDSLLSDVKEILQTSFNLTTNELSEYIDCFNSPPEIREIPNEGLFLMKGSQSGIAVSRINQLFIDKTLPTLWNAMFHIYLSDDKEPIILRGNSGFKTFLSQQFLPKAQTITLNQETTIAQLLGASAFMTTEEAKLFYIEWICNIIHKDSLIIELRDKWTNGALAKNELDQLILDAKRSGNIPSSFFYAIDHLNEELFSRANNDCVLSNTVLEFRPGIFLSSILQGKSLILKNLANLPTEVLERFNELFSGKQNITLSEDIHNTFTATDNKELSNFNDNFRVFATCTDSSKLSEAVLSRFSVISVSDYKPEEEKFVLISYIQMKRLLFNQDDIEVLSRFAESYKETFKHHLTFPQMIKVIEITAKLNQRTSQANQKLNIGISLYRILGGIFDSSKKELLFECIKNFFDIPPFYGQQINDRLSLTVETRDNCSGITSIISTIFMKCSLAKEIPQIYAFTQTFNDLLDLIHMGLTIHNPIILEGSPGQGKHTAIQCIGEMMSINIVSIMISQTTKVEDLFGKEIITRRKDGIHVEMVETPFTQIITNSNSGDKNSLIILENINYASAALLNALVPVFHTDSHSIILPNGRTIKKGRFDILAIFNSQRASSGKDKLLSSIINSSIYAIVPKPKESEVLNIILTKFILAKLSKDEAIRFNENYNKAQIISKGVSSTDTIFTLNDIEKYLKLRELTANFFHETTISQMIFAYKFSSEQLIQRILNDLVLDNLKFAPIFEYDVPLKHLLVRISNESTNALSLELKSSPKDTSILHKINSLTLAQKHCLIFLICSILAKRTCVVQGDTASGKSHVVRLLADIAGAKLNVFQLNSDTNTSIFSRRSILTNTLSQADIGKFKKAFIDLSINDSIRQYITDDLQIRINDSSTFNPKSLKMLLHYIQSIESDIKKEDYYERIEQAVKLIKETMSPINRFKHEESVFVNAITNGEWVLLDGIEAAPSIIAEKISSLCGEQPELNLFEYGPEYCFSKNKISDNFHLFIIYNPYSKKDSELIDQTFLMKSLTFTLPAIDDKKQSSAQMMIGSLINLNFQPDISKQLGSRYATMHDFAKKESLKNTDNFAGDIPFNGRTLTFATKVISSQNEKCQRDPLTQLSQSISLAIKSFYLNSYSGKSVDDFKNNMLNSFMQQPEESVLSSLNTESMTYQHRNWDLLILLRNIQKFALGRSPESNYKFSDLINLCKKTSLSDIEDICKDLNDTLEILQSKSNPDYIMQFGTLHVINSIFEMIKSPSSPIIQEHSCLKLCDKTLKTNSSILVPLTKFELLNDLVASNLFSDNCSILLDNEPHCQIIKAISQLVTNQNKSQVFDFFKTINRNINDVDFIQKVFPYTLFVNSPIHKISLWLPLLFKLLHTQIRISFIIDNEKLEFNYLSKCDFSFDLILNENNNLSLSENSMIKYSNNKKSMKVKKHPENENDKYDYKFYYVMDDLANDDKQIVNDKLLKAILSKVQNLISKPVPLINNIVSLTDLFEDTNGSNSISLIWNLIFTLPDDDIHNLSKIIHPIESQMLSSALHIYSALQPTMLTDIHYWSKWSSLLENSAATLYKSISTEFTPPNNPNQVSQMIQAIGEEIKYLKQAPEGLKEYWTSSNLINKCEQYLHDLLVIQQINDGKREIYEREMEVKKKINDTRISLISKKISKKYQKMQEQLAKKLNDIKEYTIENLNSAQKIVSEFLVMATSSAPNDKTSAIIWPQINITKLSSLTPLDTETIQLFKALIWYSQIKAILSDIIAGSNIIQNVWKLNDFEELEYPRENMFTTIITNNQSKLPLQNTNQALYTLNAHMIIKLYEVNRLYIQDRTKIVEVLNKYMNRTNCSDAEINYIYHAVTTLPSNLSLTIPQFCPNDLVFLIVNKRSKHDYRTGPLFLGIQDVVFLKDMKNLMYQKFTSFSQAAQSIGEIVYQSILCPNQQPPSDYQALKQQFQGKCHGNKFQIIKRINTLFEIADCLEKQVDINLKFDDISFLTTDILTDMNFLSRFPSLVFWLLKYPKTANLLKSELSGFTPNQKEIPLWLLALRLMSSLHCIEFETKGNGEIAEIIGSTITNIIIQYLRNLQQPINYNWINLLLTNLPQVITKPEIQIIRQYFQFLSLDNQKYPSKEINAIKIASIKRAIQSITKSILKDDYQQLVNDPISNQHSNSETAFLVYPSKYITNEINNEIQRIRQSIFNNDSTKSFKQYLVNIDNLKSIINRIKYASDGDQKEMDDHCNQKVQNTKEKLRKKKVQEVSDMINEYNKLVCSLLHDKDLLIDDNKSPLQLKQNHLIYKRLQKNVEQLIDCQQKLKIYREIFKDEEEVTILTVQYQNASRWDVNISITNGHLTIKTYLPKIRLAQQYRSYYFFPGDKLSKDDNDMYFRYNHKSTGLLHFKYIKEHFDVNNLITNAFIHYSIEIPQIVFGNYSQNLNTFLSKINELYNSLISANTQVFEVLDSNKAIDYNIFTFITNLNNLLDTIFKNLTAEFSDRSRAARTQNVLQNDLKEYLDNLKPLVQEVLNLLNTNLKPIWKAKNDNKQFTTLFNFQYDVKIPDSISSHKPLPNFSRIQNLNSLASPILLISPENKIVCSATKLLCQIEPVFPSLIYNPYSINIISFINETIECKIELDPQFEKYLTIKDTTDINEPIQLFLIPPASMKDEPEIIALSGSIHLKSKSFDSCKLPFEITFPIFSLKSRLRCLEYKLSLDEQAIRLCCDKVFSESKIHFEVLNYYLQNHFVMSVEIEPLDENESSQPSILINKTKRQFSISIPKVDKPTRSQMNIIIALSQTFITTIHCDFIILPLIFSFEIFDVIAKRYESTLCQLYFTPGVTKSIHLRMSSYLPFTRFGRMNYKIPDGMQLSRPGHSINDNFEINGHFDMDLELYIPNRRYYIYGNWYIQLEIGTFHKLIRLEFVDPATLQFSPYSDIPGNKKFLEVFPTYMYNYQHKIWISVKNFNDIKANMLNNNPYVIVSPQSHFTNIEQFTIVRYDKFPDGLASESYTSILYCQLSLALDDIPLMKTNKNPSLSRLYLPKDQQTLLTRIKNIFTNSSNFINYFSIIGYDANNKNIWFPIYDKYPKVDTFTQLKYEEKYVAIAEKNLDLMITSIIPNLTMSLLSEYFTKSFVPKYIQTNFAILIAIFRQESAILQFEALLAEMPEEIQQAFADILADIRLQFTDLDKISHGKIFVIISHNIILRFCHIFAKKYQELKSHLFCLQMPLTKSEIDNQQSKALNEYKSQSIGKVENIAQFNSPHHFSQLEAQISQIDIPTLPLEEKRFECIIISEHEPMKPCLLRDGLGYFNFSSIYDESSIFSGSINTISSLPSIELPKVPSVNSMNRFYAVCAQGSSILPNYVRSKRIANADQKDAESYFGILFNIYLNVTAESTTNRSIFSENINSFIEAFQNCVKRLKRAGVEFSKMNLPPGFLSYDRSHITQDFIRYPEIETPTLRHMPWKTKHQFSENFINFTDPIMKRTQYQSIDSLIDNSSANQFESLNDNVLENELSESIDVSTPNENYSLNAITNEDMQFIWGQVATVNDILAANNDEDEIEDIEESEQSEVRPPVASYVVNQNVVQENLVDSKSVDGLFSKIDELDGIKRVVERIKQTKYDAKLKFLNSSECRIDNQDALFNIQVKSFPVKSLLDNSQYLIANLIIKASDTNCPFQHMSCNLLIDCSCYISIENKLYNFMVMSAFSYALAALEIPFSICIVADKNFRFILKPFTENISLLVLQRVLDCLFIKRFRTNLADTLHHAIEFMKCPYPDRTQRAFFLFSNGIDDNLVMAQSWKESILNNPNFSFGLYFVKSKLLDDSKYSSILSMWDHFSKTVKNAPSITRLTSYNPDFTPQIVDIISTHFAEVLNRSNDQQFEYTMKLDIMPEFRDNFDMLTYNTFQSVKNEIDYNYQFDASIFRKSDRRFEALGTKFPKTDTNFYKNKTEKFTHCSVESHIREPFDRFIHKIITSHTNTYRPLLETIFKPNKASLSVLSDSGTDFDITALLLYLINPVPNPMIYLEEKGGLLRNYGVSIIIDSSQSCFNPFSSTHSYQTIKTLLTALGSIGLPYIDVIIATNQSPIVLCSQMSSTRLLNEKSPFWPSLFNCLNSAYFQGSSNQTSSKGTCALENALHTAYDIRRMRATDSTSFMFVLTDGLFEKEHKEVIKSSIMTCMQTGFSVFGIGIGLYPIGITNIFPQAIYVPNPNNLIHGIASFFGDNSVDSYGDSIERRAPQPVPFSVFRSCFETLIQNENKPIFKDLKEYLYNTHHFMDAFSDIYNEEQEQRNERGELINPDGANLEMYQRNCLEGQKILIVMLYDNTLNIAENQYVTKRYLTQPQSAGDKAFVKSAVAFFGIDIVIVQNYKDAIRELTKQTQPGKCDYYATWVLSGLPYDVQLPDGGNQYLVDQFIDCLIQFWNNGGSVVMFSEGDPLTFQTNLFLEKIVFPGSVKTKLRVGGNHKGKGTLHGDETGQLQKPGLFNKSKVQFNRSNRASLGHNLQEIYEGETISFAANDLSKCKPFIPFMIDSENGVSCLFYNGGCNQHHTCDIIIDCGYTKLFDKMTEKGTFKYIQNVAGWTAQVELKLTQMGIHPKNYRPNAVLFQLDESKKYPLAKPPDDGLKESVVDVAKLRTLFAIDHSGSVHNFAVYHNKLRQIFNQYYKNGDVIITWGSRVTKISYSEMQRIINSQEGTEGTDPSVIAQALVNDSSLRCEHLILVTDGMVGSGSVQESDSIMRRCNFVFRYVTTYVISNNGDLSVGAPFARGCGSHTIHVTSNGSERRINGANSVDFRILDSIDNIISIAQFRNSFRQIFAATKQKMIGSTGDHNLKAKFENLKTRLLRDQGGSLHPKADQILAILINMASGSHQNVFSISSITAMEDTINSLQF